MIDDDCSGKRNDRTLLDSPAGRLVQVFGLLEQGLATEAEAVLLLEDLRPADPDAGLKSLARRALGGAP